MFGAIWEGGALHINSTAENAVQLVPYEQPGELLERPLLPYERELIRVIGCTEQNITVCERSPIQEQG